VPMSAVPAMPHPQYELLDLTNYYQSYKRRRGIKGAILVLVGQLKDNIPSSEPDCRELLNMTNIFSAFTTLPYEAVDSPIYAFPIVNNKANTLTQSQMLKAADSAKFIASQPKELQGLIDMGGLTLNPYLPNLKMPVSSVLSGAIARNLALLVTSLSTNLEFALTAHSKNTGEGANKLHATGLNTSLKGYSRKAFIRAPLTHVFSYARTVL
jgi:hypothetical protein